MPCSTHTIGAVLRSFCAMGGDRSCSPSQASKPARSTCRDETASGLPRTPPEFPIPRESGHPKVALNTCEKAPTLRSTTAPPLPLSVVARKHVARMPPARSGLALPGSRMAACVELGFSLNFADAAAPESPRVGPELRTQPPSSRGRLLPSHGVAPASPRAPPVGNARSPARQRTKVKLLRHGA